MYRLQPILPSSFSKDDCNAILYHAIKELKKQKRQSDGIIFAETIVASQAFVDSCLKHFETLINLKADKVSISLVRTLTALYRLNAYIFWFVYGFSLYTFTQFDTISDYPILF